MRTVNVDKVTEAVREMCISANYFLSPDMEQKLSLAVEEEESPLGKQILIQLQENLQIAGEEQIPICQDTGMAVVFMEIGQEVHLRAAISGRLSTRGSAAVTWRDICENLWWEIPWFGKIQRIILRPSCILRLCPATR